MNMTSVYALDPRIHELCAPYVVQMCASACTLSHITSTLYTCALCTLRARATLHIVCKPNTPKRALTAPRGVLFAKLDVSK